MQNRLTNADSCVIILFVDYGWVPERPKGADCKSVVTDYDGSNPSPSTKAQSTLREGVLCFLRYGGISRELKQPHCGYYALVNTDETFRFDAPIALSMPISCVLSRTDIYVIMPIIRACFARLLRSAFDTPESVKANSTFAKTL